MAFQSMLLRLLSLALVLEPCRVGASTVAHPPLRVEGQHVIDKYGQRVFLACVNWYGAFLEQMVVNGLNKQPVAKIASLVRSMGFNCVRLPFSLDMVYSNLTQVPKPNITLAANPQLQHKSPLEVFDATVTALTSAGVAVILNNHISSSGWCCSLSDGEGLWYTDKYPQDAWFRAVGFMAARYRNNNLVVGFDLRNEIRPSMLGTPTWGTGDSSSDWSIAAVEGAKYVLKANEDMLIIISGLYFSIFLCDIPRRPVHETVPELRGRTIYTSHEYKWVNFHLAARAMVGGYLTMLVFWWAGLWLLAGLGWKLGQNHCLASGGMACSQNLQCGRPTRLVRLARLCCCCRSCRCGWTRNRAELIAAVVLTMASMISLGITEFVLDKCSLFHLLLSMGLLCGAMLFAVVSLLLWMRLAVVCVQESQTPMEWPAVVQAPGSQELTPPLPRSPASGTAVQELRQQPCGGEELQEIPRRSFLITGGSSLQMVARSPRCLAFSVSGVLLVALALVWVLYGRYDAFAGELDSRWGFLVKDNGQSKWGNAPVWIGEFGSNVDDLWWQHILHYMYRRELAGWAYWSLNGEKRTDMDETFGLLNQDSITVRHPWKLEALQGVILAQGNVSFELPLQQPGDLELEG